MNKVKYQSQLADMSEKRNVWRYLSVAMLVSNLLLAFHLMQVELKEKTIIVPADLSKEFWVDGDQVSPSYLEEMGNMYGNWFKNFNPENVDSQFAKVLQYSDPRVYSEMKDWLDAEAARVKEIQITSTFFPLSIRIDGNMVEINARMISMIGKKVINDDVKVLRMNLRYHAGRLIIGGFEEGQYDKSGEYYPDDKESGLARYGGR